MSDFINKVVSIALVFVMLVLAPLLISYKSDDMLAKRVILSDVTSFIDKAKDTSTITQDDLNKLYMACNSHGLAVDVSVKKLIRTDVTDSTGAITTVYYAVSNPAGLQVMNSGDIVKVTVTEVGIATSRKLMYNILKIDEGQFEFSLAGTVG